MIEKLYPSAYYKRIFNIPLERLKEKGINNLIFDIDNTLSPFDRAEPDEETASFIKKAVDEGFFVCLLSNNSKKRVSLYNRQLNVYAVHRANKPLISGLKKAMGIMGGNVKNTVLIGDQIFTDIWCGNRAGIKTILVMPCSDREIMITKVKRGIEGLIIKKYLKERRKK